MNIAVKLSKTKIPVQIEGEDGQVKTYELREMKSSARDAYMDRLNSRMRFDKEGKPIGLDKYEGLQADLLSNTLHDDQGKLVPASVIQDWPASATSELFKAAQKLNHLGEEDKKDQPVKND